MQISFLSELLAPLSDFIPGAWMSIEMFPNYFPNYSSVKTGTQWEALVSINLKGRRKVQMLRWQWLHQDQVQPIPAIF